MGLDKIEDMTHETTFSYDIEVDLRTSTASIMVSGEAVSRYRFGELTGPRWLDDLVGRQKLRRQAQRALDLAEGQALSEGAEEALVGYETVYAVKESGRRFSRYQSTKPDGPHEAFTLRVVRFSGEAYLLGSPVHSGV